MAIADQLVFETKHIIQEDENLLKQSSRGPANYAHYTLSSSTKSKNNSPLIERIEDIQTLVESIKTRKSILDDENCFLRSEYQKMQRHIAQLQRSQLQLQEKIKLYQESAQPTPLQQRSTKLGYTSESSSGGQQYGNGHLRRSLEHP